MKKGTKILLGIGSVVFIYWWLFKKDSQKVEETPIESAPPPPPPSSPMPPSEPPPTPPSTAPSTAPSSTGMQPTAICVKYSVTNTRPIVDEMAGYINIDYMTCQGEPESHSSFDGETSYVYAIEGSIKSSDPDFNYLVFNKV